MIWAHVARSKVASKTGGISFNLGFFCFFLERMCVCMATQAAALRLSPQENFNLPVDPCDGATANSLGQPAGVQILSSHPQHNVYIFYMLHQRLSFAFFCFFFLAFFTTGISVIKGHSRDGDWQGVLL